MGHGLCWCTMLVHQTMNHRRAVISAEPGQIEEVTRLVRDGRYRSVSDFVRQALTEALRRERERQLAEQVEAYVSAGHATEDADLSLAQAWPDAPRPPARRRRCAKK